MRLLLSFVIFCVSWISRRAVAISFLDCSSATEILRLDITARTIQQIKKVVTLDSCRDGRMMRPLPRYSVESSGRSASPFSGNAHASFLILKKSALLGEL